MDWQMDRLSQYTEQNPGFFAYMYISGFHDKAVTWPTVEKSSEFYWILLDLLEFAFFEKRLMDQRTNKASCFSQLKTDR